MNNLWQNPLAQMSEPLFLILLASVVVIFILLSRWVVSLADTSRSQKTALLPDQLDPYEVAFLRGGAEEAMRLAVLSLVRQGFLDFAQKVSRTGKSLDIVESNHHPESTALSGVEQIVFDGLANSGAGFQIGALSLTEAVEKYYAPCKALLRKLELLASSKMERVSMLARFTGMAVLGALVGYKWTVGGILEEQDSLRFYLLLALISVGVFWLNTKPHWLSARGKEYLNLLTDRFRLDAATLDFAKPLNAPRMLLLVGIFGFSLLDSTGFAGLNHAFKDQEAAAAAAGGTSSSGGCGGCGGCRGCGCGG